MNLDGVPVFTGNSVYCLHHGTGTITEINSIFCIVNFGPSKSQVRFSLHGELGPMRIRTLYWHNPIIAKIPKDQKRYNLIKSLITGVMSSINQHGS